ncbi:MAG: hypothetical protein AAGF01_16575 [Cyanobacteria bacterium P01_G01_bin.38]
MRPPKHRTSWASLPIAAALLISCTDRLEGAGTAPSSSAGTVPKIENTETDSTVTPSPPNLVESSDTLGEVAYERLPQDIEQRLQTAIAQELNVPTDQLLVMRANRETWTDGCLGLGGPAESCLAALTEGWQIEVRTTEDNQHFFYRTDLTGESIRRSTLDNNLPPSVRDRLLQLTAEKFEVPRETLSVTAADAEVWSGCMGLAPSPDTPCTAIAIPGWRATVSDGSQTWVYHTDGVANDIRLKE